MQKLQNKKSFYELFKKVNVEVDKKIGELSKLLSLHFFDSKVCLKMIEKFVRKII